MAAAPVRCLPLPPFGRISLKSRAAWRRGRRCSSAKAPCGVTDPDCAESDNQPGRPLTVKSSRPSPSLRTVSGALGGLAADVAAGGLTFGAGAILGGIAGAVGARKLTQRYNEERGLAGGTVRWSDEFLEARLAQRSSATWRLRISVAALLVKVIARIEYGAAPFFMRWRMR